MNIDVIERMEMIFAIGIILITMLVYAGLGVAALVVASKKKKTDPKDAKNWKTVAIILLSICGVEVIGTIAAFAVPAILSNLSIVSV